MTSIFPEDVAGGVPIRNPDGSPTNNPDVSNAYVPAPAYVITCVPTALPSDCSARIEPRQINAIVSELLSFAECLDPNGPWDCAKLNNLCAAFTTWYNGFNGTLDAKYVNVTGDTMTGALHLPPGAPTAPEEAANKKYVDDSIASAEGLDESKFVNVTGDTMTGPLTIHPATGPASSSVVSSDNVAIMQTKSVAGGGTQWLMDAAIGAFSNEHYGQRNGVARWLARYGNSVAETGARAGSDYDLYAFDDAGANPINVLHFSRATGLGTIKGDPVVALGIATKGYVDTVAAGGGAGTPNAVRWDVVQALTLAQRTQGRQNIAAAPFDAYGWAGIQLNGNFEVSQERGALGNNVGGYFADGWVFNKVGTMGATAQQVVGVIVNGHNSYGNVSIQIAQPAMTAPDYLIISHRIEGYRMARLQWGIPAAQPLTIGFWSAHHRPGLYTGTVLNAAQNRCYPFSYNHVTPDVAQFNAITIPGDTAGIWNTTNGVGAYVYFAMAAGATNTAPTLGNWQVGSFIAGPGQVNGVAAVSDVFRITGFLMLPGIELPAVERTPFIMRPFHTELVNSQRYWQKSFQYANMPAFNLGPQGALVEVAGSVAPGAAVASLRWPARMRTAPTVATFNPSLNENTWFDSVAGVGRLAMVADMGESGGRIVMNAASSQGAQHFIHYTADARL